MVNGTIETIETIEIIGTIEIIEIIGTIETIVSLKQCKIFFNEEVVHWTTYNIWTWRDPPKHLKWYLLKDEIYKFIIYK